MSSLCPSMVLAGVCLHCRFFFIASNMLLLFSKQAFSISLRFTLSRSLFCFLITRWYRFLVFFIIWCSWLFSGFPADNQIACQKYAFSLNGSISSFQAGIVDFHTAISCILNRAKYSLHKMINRSFVICLFTVNVLTHQMSRNMICWVHQPHIFSSLWYSTVDICNTRDSGRTYFPENE